MKSLPNYIIELLNILKNWKKITIKLDQGETLKPRKIIKLKR